MLDKENIDKLLKNEKCYISWFETGKYVVFAFENSISIVVTINKENDVIEYKLTNNNGSIIIGIDKLYDLNIQTIKIIIAKAVRIIKNIENEFKTFN